MSARDLVEQYRSAGATVIPIRHNRKAPPPIGWAEKSMAELWKGVTEPINLAIRLGDNGLFLLDPDDDQAVTMIGSFFEQIQVMPFMVRTRSGRLHYYIRTNLPESMQMNGHLRNMKGDWRARHGYGLVPPSSVNGDPYQFANPIQPMLFPFVHWKDLIPVIDLDRNKAHSRTRPENQLPLVRMPLPAWIRKMVHAIEEAAPGDSIEVSVNNLVRRFPSRSEAVWALTCRLIELGHSSTDLISMLSVQGRPESWLEKTYQRAYAELAGDPFRQKAEWVHARASTAELGPLRTLYLALIALAWSKADSDYSTEITTLVKHTGGDAGQLNKNLELLSKRGLINYLSGEGDELEIRLLPTKKVNWKKVLHSGS